MSGTVSDADEKDLISEISSMGLEASVVFPVEEGFYDLIGVRVGGIYFDVYPCHDGGWGCNAVAWRRPTHYGRTPGEAFRAWWSAEKKGKK